MNDRELTTFELFVHDDRYSVPTLHLICELDEGRARDAAEALLRSNPHHLGVELCSDGLQILTLGACGDRRLDPMRVATGG